MKISVFSRPVASFLFTGLFCGSLLAQTPTWWSTNGLINSNPAADNNVATQGQAKHVVDTTRQYFDSVLGPVGGAGTEIDTLVALPWFRNLSDNNLVVTNSQTKFLTAPIYDRLQAIGFSDWPSSMTVDTTTGYPWTSTTSDDKPDAVTTIGQLKFLVSWELGNWLLIDSENSGAGDGIPDWWESFYFSNLTTLTSLTLDHDMDGLDNGSEFLFHSNPSIGDTDSDGLLDGADFENGQNPIEKDHPDVVLVLWNAR
ncbi:MAG: hypothetical protein AAFX93_20200 [Verrucomicrobiota bacterium]